MKGKDSVTRPCQIIRDKSIADCVEALIGAFFEHGGINNALKLMSWFGIDCFSNANNNSAKLHRGRGKYADFIPPQTALFRESDENTKFVREQYEGRRFNSLEKCINYTFMEKSFLIQAFSHMSYYRNRSTDCYQRLEFLGDAILDFLIIAHLYACDEELDPSRLTSIKSALVNNNTFALLAVRFNLHKYLLHFEQKLESAIKQYIDLQEEDIKRMLEVCPCATYDRPLLLLHIVCTCICVFVCVFAHKYSLVHVCVCAHVHVYLRVFVRASVLAILLSRYALSIIQN